MANQLDQAYPIPLGDGGIGASLSDPGADRILFWDDSAGAVTWLTAGSGLTITGTTMTASGGGSGSIVQVVQGSTTSTVDLTSSGGTYVSSGVTATITPTSTSNYLLITGNIAMNAAVDQSNGSTTIGLKLYAAGSELFDYVRGCYFSNGTWGNNANSLWVSPQYYYSPASTSSITYAYYVNQSVSGSTPGGGYICPANEPSSIIIMEIVP